MGAFVDLTGKTFGRLIVQYRDGSKRGSALWLCLCSCGKKVKVSNPNLQSENTRSCGCLKEGRQLEHLEGQVFGRLTVLRQGEWYFHRKGKVPKWVCQCSCGIITTVVANNLKSGATRSCGCLEKQNQQRAKRHGQARSRKATAAYTMLSNAKKRARIQSVPFNLSLSDITIPEVCPVLGITLLKSTTGTCAAYSPSLDKIIPSLGYVKGNVAVISHRANTIKQNATAKELYQVAAWLEKEMENTNATV